MFNLVNVDELGNWIESGKLWWKNKEYSFEDYFIDGDEYVMINWEDKDTEDWIEVFKISCPLGLVAIIETNRGIEIKEVID